MKNSIFTLQSIPVVYLAKQGLSVEEYANFCGECFASSWKVAKEQQWPLKQIARAIGLNYAPMGANVVVTEEDDAVTVKISGIAYSEFAKKFGVKKEIFERFFEEVSAPIYDYLDIKHKINVDNEIVSVTLTK